MVIVSKRGKLSDHLVIQLTREIIGGRLRSGDLLPSESELAARFGISKAVARESLQVLESAGLIRIKQGKRTVVLDRSEWNVLTPAIQQAYWLEGRASELIRELYEIRLILESKAAAWAAARVSENDLEKLDELLREMRTVALTTKDVEAFLVIDRAFHDVIANATGNIVLRGVMRNLHSYLSSGWSRSELSGEDLELVADQHARIAGAIRARDPNEAERTMEAHLIWAQKIEGTVS